jgi:prevent-host-death family protein
MARAGIAELKAGLSAFLERVKAGEDIVVTDHGRPVALLTRVHSASDEVERLVSKGILRSAKEPLDLESFARAARPADPDRRALRALLDDRESGL